MSSTTAPPLPAAGAGGGNNLFGPNAPGSTYMVNSKIMVVAVAVLFGVVLFVFCIHIYAKWFWRNHTSMGIVQAPGLGGAPGGGSGLLWSRRRRGQLNFLRVFENNNNNNNGNGNSSNGGLGPGHSMLDGFGLDKAVVELLPTFVYRAAEMKGHGAAALECAVCLEEFEEKETGRLLPRCNHSFHLDCIDMWFHSHSNCPLCRTSVKAPDHKILGIAAAAAAPGTPRPPHESWQLESSNPRNFAAPSLPPGPHHQQLSLLAKSRNTESTVEGAAGESSLHTVSSSSSSAGSAVPHQGSILQQDVLHAESAGMDDDDSGDPRSEEPGHHQEVQQNQAPTTTTTTTKAGQERIGSNYSGLNGQAAHTIPPNVLFWGSPQQSTHPNAAAESPAPSLATTMSTTAMAANPELQQQQQGGVGGGGAGFASSGLGGVTPLQASSSVAVEIMAPGRSPVAVAEAEGSSRSHMARLVSLKRLVSRGRPPVAPASSSSSMPQNSSQASDLEQGASSSSSSSSSSLSSRIPDASTASNILGFFLSS